LNNGHLDFESAILQAKNFIQDRRFKNGFDLATPEGYQSNLADFASSLASYQSWTGFSGNLVSEKPGEFSDKKAQDNWDRNVDSLIAGAEANLVAFQAILLGVASEVEKGAELHPKLRKWIAEYLRGRILPPPKGKGRGESTGLHNIIAHAVADLVESGMRPTRNDEGPAFSACDAVANALTQLSLSPPTFHGVKRVWIDWDKPSWIR
jgi:hypothetical protein